MFSKVAAKTLTGSARRDASTVARAVEVGELNSVLRVDARRSRARVCNEEGLSMGYTRLAGSTLHKSRLYKIYHSWVCYALREYKAHKTGKAKYRISAAIICSYSQLENVNY